MRATLFQRVLGVLLWGALLGLAAPDMLAQGRLAGRVTDEEDGRALEGVNVILAETALGTTTTFDGTFLFERLRPGTYTVVMSLIGYGTVEARVQVQEGQEARLDASLMPRAIQLDEVLAQADRPYTAASSLALRQFDLITRPSRSAQDLLRLAPGLITAQHAGGGKAEQIFLRGFDADHGTDINISIDGVPVNMVSHGHGQGYADLHFVIPEVVQRIDVFKGPYNAAYGNLATAGAIRFATRDHLDENLIRVEGGAFSTKSLTALYQIPTPGPHQGAYLAGQYYNTDGPFESPQGFQRFNLFGKFHTHLSESSRLSFTASGFSSAWDASGQVPARAVEEGLIDRFGSIDDLEGGTTSRQDLNIQYEASRGNERFTMQAFASRYTFKLFSNFTFFLEDPVHGDMIEQTDDRALYGMNGQYQFTQALGTALATTTLGGGFRSDDATVALWKSPNRVRRGELVDSDVIERNLFLWVQEDFVLAPAIRLLLGLRADYFTHDVDDNLEGVASELPHASGYAQQAILSPKASLVVSPAPTVDVFANFGTGFHSNDSRDIVIDRRVADLVKVYERQGYSEREIDELLVAQRYDPGHLLTGTLPRAVGGELGFRTRLARTITLSAVGWLLDLESEFVYVGDGGFTEPSGPSRRYGVDLETRLGLTSWLAADADLNLSRGYLKDEPAEANSIPLAPRVTSTGGLTALHPKGYEGSLRYVHVGDRPANEDGSVTAQGYTIFTLLAAYRFGAVKLNCIVENVFDAAWNEAQFDTESRLPGELEPISELHFTPGNPRNIRLGLTFLF